MLSPKLDIVSNKTHNLWIVGIAIVCRVFNIGRGMSDASHFSRAKPPPAGFSPRVGRLVETLNMYCWYRKICQTFSHSRHHQIQPQLLFLCTYLDPSDHTPAQLMVTTSTDDFLYQFTYIIQAFAKVRHPTISAIHSCMCPVSRLLIRSTFYIAHFRFFTLRIIYERRRW